MILKIQLSMYVKSNFQVHLETRSSWESFQIDELKSWSIPEAHIVLKIVQF